MQTYIDAPSLETVIKQGRKFTEAEAVELADRLLSILIYLHEQHPPVIHRDIKPSNILIGNRSGNSIGDVYLVDFGSVQTAASKDEGTITIVGSYGYIPLEQFGGQTRTVSDLYSLGMTIIYLLTGIHPAELAQVNGQIKFTAEIGNHFRRWLDKMTQPYLDKRFESAQIAQSSLKSEDEDRGGFIHVPPPNAQTKLAYNQDKLEIILSSKFLSTSIRVQSFEHDITSSPHQPFEGYGCFLTILTVPLMCVFSGYIGVFIILNLIAWSVIGYINTKYIENRKLIIDNDSVRIIRLPQQKEISKMQRLNPTVLIYNPGYIFDRFLDVKGNIKDAKLVISPELYIESGIHKCLIGNGLSQAELYWLGQELSSFMNLELQVIYPTPQEPPETPPM